MARREENMDASVLELLKGVELFSELSDEQLGVVIDKLDKLSNIIEQIRSELDV